MILEPTVKQREAFSRAAELIALQAEGLRRTGSQTTQAALMEYAATLRRLAEAKSVAFAETEKKQVENASFVLEGIRDGLLTTEFRDRARAIDEDIRALNDVIAEYNAAP